MNAMTRAVALAAALVVTALSAALLDHAHAIAGPVPGVRAQARGEVVQDGDRMALFAEFDDMFEDAGAIHRAKTFQRGTPACR